MVTVEKNLVLREVFYTSAAPLISNSAINNLNFRFACEPIDKSKQDMGRTSEPWQPFAQECIYLQKGEEKNMVIGRRHRRNLCFILNPA